MCHVALPAGFGHDFTTRSRREIPGCRLRRGLGAGADGPRDTQGQQQDLRSKSEFHNLLNLPSVARRLEGVTVRLPYCGQGALWWEDNRAMNPWRTAIVNSDETHIWTRGYDITDLMRQAGFVSTIFLLHRGRLPTEGERRVLDALLVAVSDHGAGAPSCATARLAASGNRGSISAAVAAGILAIGDEHGGAGEGCMELIAQYAPAAVRGGQSIEEAAVRAVEETRAAGGRVPGLGHRKHTVDPRVEVLFGMAEAEGIAGEGVAFIRALEAATARLVKPLPINIDGALAAVLHDMECPPSAGKYFFIVGRIAGLTAEVAEEHAREKAMRIRIPIVYDGEPPRSMP